MKRLIVYWVYCEVSLSYHVTTVPYGFGVHIRVKNQLDTEVETRGGEMQPRSGCRVQGLRLAIYIHSHIVASTLSAFP